MYVSLRPSSLGVEMTARIPMSHRQAMSQRVLNRPLLDRRTPARPRRRKRAMLHPEIQGEHLRQMRRPQQCFRFVDPCATEPATDVNSICGAIVLPANYQGGTIRVSYHFFDAMYWNAETQTPLGPPTLFVWEAIPNGVMTTRPTESNADLAAIKSCEAYAVRVPVDPEQWATLAGKDLYVYANVYLPMGGADTWQAKEGIDYGRFR